MGEGYHSNVKTHNTQTKPFFLGFSATSSFSFFLPLFLTLLIYIFRFIPTLPSLTHFLQLRSIRSFIPSFTPYLHGHPFQPSSHRIFRLQQTPLSITHLRFLPIINFSISLFSFYSLFYFSSLKCFIFLFFDGSARKGEFFVVRSDARMNHLLSRGAQKSRTQKLLTNAVAVSCL